MVTKKAVMAYMFLFTGVAAHAGDFFRRMPQSESQRFLHVYSHARGVGNRDCTSHSGTNRLNDLIYSYSRAMSGDQNAVQRLMQADRYEVERAVGGSKILMKDHETIHRYIRHGDVQGLKQYLDTTLLNDGSDASKWLNALRLNTQAEVNDDDEKDVVTSQYEVLLLPLTCAARKGNSEIIKLLVASGADVNGGDALSSPLREAISENHQEVAQLLRELGARGEKQ